MLKRKSDSLGNNLPLEPTRTISFTTTMKEHGCHLMFHLMEKTIIFDLVGDIYSMPFRGGDAEQITSGIAFDSQPVFSPNGRNDVICK